MIYLIAGRGRSGKNTYGKFLKKSLEKRGKKVCEIELMRTLKGYCKDYFGWDGKEETKPRELLQQVGTELIREKMNKPLFHLHRLIEDIEILQNFYEEFIVDDVRFPLEIEEIKKSFPEVVVIYIERENYNDGMNEKERKHKTETSLDDFEDYDWYVKNTTLESLEEDAENLVKEVDE